MTKRNLNMVISNTSHGLTIREYTIIMAMQGLLADGDYSDWKTVASAAVKIADATLQEMEK